MSASYDQVNKPLKSTTKNVVDAEHDAPFDTAMLFDIIMNRFKGNTDQIFTKCMEFKDRMLHDGSYGNKNAKRKKPADDNGSTKKKIVTSAPQQKQTKIYEFVEWALPNTQQKKGRSTKTSNKQ